MQAFDNFLSVLKWQRHFRTWRTWFWKNLLKFGTHFLALNAFLFPLLKKKPLYKSLWEDRAYQEGSLAVYTFSLYPPLLRPRLLSSFFPSSRRLRGKRKILKVREELQQPRMSVHFFFFFLSFVESSSSPGWLLSFFNICNFPMLRAAASASAKFGLSLRPLS